MRSAASCWQPLVEAWNQITGGYGAQLAGSEELKFMVELSEILQLCVRRVACEWHLQADVPTQIYAMTCKPSFNSS